MINFAFTKIIQILLMLQLLKNDMVGGIKDIYSRWVNINSI